MTSHSSHVDHSLHSFNTTSHNDSLISFFVFSNLRRCLLQSTEEKRNTCECESKHTTLRTKNLHNDQRSFVHLLHKKINEFNVRSLAASLRDQNTNRTTTKMKLEKRKNKNVCEQRQPASTYTRFMPPRSVNVHS